MLAIDCVWERYNKWLLIPLALIYFVDSLNFMGSSVPKLRLYVPVVTRPKKALLLCLSLSGSLILWQNRQETLCLGTLEALFNLA